MAIVVHVNSHVGQYLFQVFGMSQTIHDSIFGLFDQNTSHHVSQSLHNFLELYVLALDLALVIAECNSTDELFLQSFDLFFEHCL